MFSAQPSLCAYYSETGFCAVGDRCQFTHDRNSSGREFVQGNEDPSASEQPRPQEHNSELSALRLSNAASATAPAESTELSSTGQFSFGVAANGDSDSAARKLDPNSSNLTDLEFRKAYGRERAPTKPHRTANMDWLIGQPRGSHAGATCSTCRSAACSYACRCCARCCFYQCESCYNVRNNRVC